MKSKKRLIIIAVLLLAVLGTAIWFLSSRHRIKNVLLISIDTCRADHLSCYGFNRKTTPNIDTLAKQGILFENTYTPLALTLPAHSSMMTGTYPPYHKVRDNMVYRLDESNLTLAEILKKNGYNTGAVVSSFILDSQFGLNQGFESYNDKFDMRLYVGPREGTGTERR